MKLSKLLPKGLCQKQTTTTPSPEDIEVRGISQDTRQISPGDLFIAICGEHFDPRHLIPKILSSGAVAIVAEEGAFPSFSDDIPLYITKDARKASAVIWSRFYGDAAQKMTMIGVTGTNGKTTTALLLAHLLEGEKQVGYIGTLGIRQNGQPLPTAQKNTMTTPDPAILYPSLAELKQNGVTHIVMEVSSHALMQQRVSPFQFDLSLFTNLSQEHLDYHKDMDSYFHAKMQLFRQSNAALINVDDSYGAQLYALLPQAISCGAVQNAAFQLTDLHEKGAYGTDYTCLYPGGSVSVSTPLLGRFNANNSFLALAAALRLGISKKTIVERMNSFAPPKGRMELLDLSAYDVPFSVMIDYAHTPEAVRQALCTARGLTKGRLIVLFGAGGERERGKRALMGQAVEEGADLAIVTSDNCRGESPSAIIRDILTGMHNRQHHRIISNRAHAIEEGLKLLAPGDLLLLLGKGHEEYDWGSHGLTYFSERELVFRFLRHMAKEKDNA